MDRGPKRIRVASVAASVQILLDRETWNVGMKEWHVDQCQVNGPSWNTLDSEVAEDQTEIVVSETS